MAHVSGTTEVDRRGRSPACALHTGAEDPYTIDNVWPETWIVSVQRGERVIVEKRIKVDAVGTTELDLAE